MGENHCLAIAGIQSLNWHDPERISARLKRSGHQIKSHSHVRPAKGNTEVGKTETLKCKGVNRPRASPLTSQ
jgi:hypothetical protein